MMDIARLAKKAGLKTVMVTNGFINSEPLTELLGYIDAFSVDLKAFNEDFYSKVTSSRLEPVKETLKQITRAGKHLEVVNLVIPELNDDDASFAEMVSWIASELGRETVLHISRYFPNFKLHTAETPVSSIRRLTRLAMKELHFVYAGNILAENSVTYCVKCNNILISRYAYSIFTEGLDSEGNCKKCGDYFLKKT
jgi:pyruvate formate lyase activating enzyme